MKIYKNKIYHIIKDDDIPVHNIQYPELSFDDISGFNTAKIMTDQEYINYCNTWNLEPKYRSFYDYNFIVISSACTETIRAEAKVVAIKYTKNTANVYVWNSFTGVTIDNAGYCIVIPISKSKNITNINVIPTYYEQEFDMIKNPDNYPVEEN